MHAPLGIARIARLRAAQVVGCLAILVAAEGSAPQAPVHAQQAAAGDRVISAGTGSPGDDFNVSATRRARGFDLFAIGDGAATGMRQSGNLSYATSNYGPCEGVIGGFCRFLVRPSRAPTTFTFQFFEIQLAAGAPPSELAKLVQVAPSAANATGGGWAYLTNFTLFGRGEEWGPADGTLGRLFSGLTSTRDFSCTDHQPDVSRVGLPLLAGSDCPQTWPQGQWRGDRPVPTATWVQAFQQLGAAFAFNFWQIPDSQKTNTFLGGNFSTYGATSDHYQEILPAYGAVLPGGTGLPTREGWPLGLEWRVDAFNFNAPGLTAVNFYQTTVVNRTAAVYGAGVDYDSLYLGFQPGTGGAGGGGGQRYANYYLPGSSTALYHQSNVRGAGGPCQDPLRATPGSTCASSTSPGSGYGNGAAATVVLKSPIGDLRYKLFSDPTSPFFSPTHPLAGDTITFNHGHMCGFGSCWASTISVNERRGFGMLSSTAANVLDGRDPATLTDTEAWRTFRNAGFPTARGVFNHWVPGVEGPAAATWDYDKDGVPDTLWFDTCHTAGCVATDWDTMPGGQLNAYGNVGGIVAAGPFPLAAGDTTSWVVAFVGETDSLTTHAAIDSAISMYLSFFTVGQPPPAPPIVSTQATPGTIDGRDHAPKVTLFFSDAPERWVDPYLVTLADDIETATAGPLFDLRIHNPWLVDSVRARAANNIEQIEVYKSCDGGRTFTADADCRGDPVPFRSRGPAGSGWRPYATLHVDDYGDDLPNVFEDSNVTAGRSYLYVLLSKSRGLETRVKDASGIPVAYSPVGSVRNPLWSPVPAGNAASVFVPISRPAGFQPARVEFTERVGGGHLPLELSLGDAVREGSYRVTFGNAIVVERDSLVAAGRAEETRVRVRREALVDVGGAPSHRTIAERTFTRHDGEPIPTAGAAGPPVVTTSANRVTESVTYRGLGFVVSDGTGTPLFASTDLRGASATPSGLFGSPDFPGFTVLANRDLVGQVVPRAARVPVTAVQWLGDSSTFTSGGGDYRVAWHSDAFNLPQGLVLDFANPRAPEAELAAALRTRPAATVGRTDAATARLLGVDQGDLVPVRVPFAIRNASFDDREVGVAMRRRSESTILVGSGRDTLRLAVPESEWIPGDALVFIERVREDSTTANGLVLDDAGDPITLPRDRVTFNRAVLGCAQPRPACNPVKAGTRGHSGYEAVRPGDEIGFAYYSPMTAGHRLVFDLVPPVTAEDVRVVTDSMMGLVRVVPNPFVMFSAYQQSFTESRLAFTNVPPAGTLRIYTVSGQFVQQIEWTPADLSGGGDLFYDLRTREGYDLASGLYIWVLTAPRNPLDAAGGTGISRGKFVVIRGNAR